MGSQTPYDGIYISRSPMPRLRQEARLSLARTEYANISDLSCSQRYCLLDQNPGTTNRALIQNIGTARS